jgi:hypothetical protein
LKRYRLCLDYFDDRIKKILKFNPNDDRTPISLYKYTVHPDLPNMAMIGAITGLFYAGFESQAKWAMSLFTGRKQLPSRDEMQADMRIDDKISKEMQNNQYQHGAYNELIDKLASQIDSMPDFEEAKRQDPLLYEMLWKNGTIPSHFCYNTNRDISIKMMQEVHDIMNKKYYFTEEELKDELSTSTSKLAKKFSKNYKIPLHLFRDL